MQQAHQRHPKQRVWTDEERRILLRDAGKLSIEAIAKELNRTTGAVRKTAQKCGISLKRLN